MRVRWCGCTAGRGNRAQAPRRGSAGASAGGVAGPAGCCPVWGDLTTVWATDPTYGPKVMLIYSDIVAFALSRRAAGQGFDDPVPIPSLPDE